MTREMAAPTCSGRGLGVSARASRQGEGFESGRGLRARAGARLRVIRVRGRARFGTRVEAREGRMHVKTS